MKTIFSLLATLLCFRAAGQDYGPYHRAVIEAERLFLDKNFPAALAAYKAVFAQYPRPFAKDCFIALQLACWQHDTASVDYFFQTAFENGINREMTGMAGHINAFLNHRYAYEKRIDSLYKVCRVRYLNKLDLDLRFEVVALLKKDGLYHEIPFTYATRALRDSLYGRVLDANVAALRALIRTHGFPGEKTIGIQDAKLDNVPGSEYWMRMSSLVSLIFYHHEWASQLLRRELRRAVRDGELHPYDYAVIYEWTYCALVPGHRWRSSADWNIPLKLTATLEPQDRHYNILPKLHAEHEYHADTAQVNKWRAEIGMASLQHDARKKEFAKRWNLILAFGMFQTN